MVDEWDAVGDPSPRSMVAQVRALVELCSVDRAWARLKPLLEKRPTVEVYQLAVGLLLDRGQISDARTSLALGQKRYPDDARLKALAKRVEQPPPPDDITDPVDNDADGQAQLAERLLTEGAPVRARRLLEKIRRQHPDNTRAADLLWALEGDFRLRGVTLADLARVHAAPTQSLVDAEETDTAGHEVPEGHAAFPSLFQSLEDRTEGWAPGEVTREITHVSAATEDEPDEEPEVTAEAVREDTQIMHVVRTNNRTSDMDGADTLIDGTFDLGAHEAVLRGESEDENVVLRRRSREVPDARSPEHTDKIELDPARDRVATGASTNDEGSDFIRPRKKAARKQQVVVEPAPPRPAKKTSKPAPESPDPGAVTPSPKQERTPPDPSTDRPTLAAAAPPPAPTSGVSLHRIPTDERPKLDPRLAAAPTEILEDPDDRPGPRFAPWTGWLLVLALLGLLVLSMGMALILYQIVSSI